MRLAAVVFLVLLLLPTVAMAGALEDGRAAYDRKDYQTALKLLQPLADQGNAEAQFDIGLLYFGGLGVKKDNTEGVNWTRKAADQGYLPAELKMGGFYRVYTGDTFPGGAFVLKEHDDVEAMKWFRKAADQGSAEAELYIGILYDSGNAGIPRNESEAVQWWRKSAERGYASAQYTLGRFYMGRSPGDKPNYDETLKWFRMAAEQNYGLALNELAVMYARGEGVTPDIVQAYKWYSLGPWKKTLVDLSAKMNPEQIAEAKRLAAEWKTAHSKAPAPADAISSQLEDGQAAFNRKDYETARKLLQPLAVNGNAKAQAVIGSMYSYARGVSQDKGEALKWYRMAADQGNTDGESGLGMVYDSLGYLHDAGKNVPENYIEAYFWLTLATKTIATASLKGSKDPNVIFISRYRDGARKHLSSEQIEAVEKRVAEWRPTPSRPPAPAEATGTSETK